MTSDGDTRALNFKMALTAMMIAIALPKPEEAREDMKETCE